MPAVTCKRGGAASSCMRAAAKLQLHAPAHAKPLRHALPRRSPAPPLGAAAGAPLPAGICGVGVAPVVQGRLDASAASCACSAAAAALRFAPLPPLCCCARAGGGFGG